jgi:hypothetical protein
VSDLQAPLAARPMLTLSVDRAGGGLRFRLDRPAERQVEPLQEEYEQRIDAPTLTMLLTSANDLLRGESRPGLADEARRLGGVLHRALVPPSLAAELRAAAGPLLVRTSVYGVPWELLHDGEEFWGLRYALGRRLVTQRPVAPLGDVRLPSRPRGLVIGADPRGDLPSVAPEIEAVATALASHVEVVCVGSALAAFDAVVDYLGQAFDLVHFAGHVVAPPAGEVSLLLGDGQALPWSVIQSAVRGHPLVVVNGCGSARGGGAGVAPTWEETLSGAAHGFLFGGAVAVVGTLAEVSDRHAAALARVFYRRLLAGNAVGEALRGARTECRAEPATADAPDWLAFVLYGNPAITLVPGRPQERAAVRARTAGPSRRAVVRGGLALAGVAAVAALARRWLRPAPLHPPVIGVMSARTAAGAVPDWMRELTRYAFTTTLKEIAGVSVFSQEKIDFLCESRKLCGIAGAEALGMTKMITPSLSAVGDQVALQVEVVDVAGNGLLELTERVQGPRTRFIELQNELILTVLERLGIRPTAAERARIVGERTNDMLESYRMLVETLGGSATPPAPEPDARRPSGWSWVGEAWAEGTSADEAAIRAVLAAYAEALSARDVDAVTRLQVAMTPDQRAALERYFGHARNLHVELSGIEVLVEGSGALASYVREDQFTDTRSGRTVQLKVRLSTRLTRVDGSWRLDLPP